MAVSGPRADGPTDAELARRAGQGDRDAFAMLMSRHRTTLHAVCRRITCHDADAEEALQNTMVLAWNRLGSFDGRAAPSTWLYRIATNAAIDEGRRRSRSAAPVEVPPDRPVAERSSGTRIDIDRALGRLPPHYRAVVVLYHLGDMTYSDVAAVLEIPVDTVKSRLSRGRQALAELLADYRPARV